MPLSVDAQEVRFGPAGLLPYSSLLEHYCSVRRQSLLITEPLTPEDMMVQSSPEASPAKWHLAHTSWFFETFILREFAPAYKPLNPDFLWLFNSYYNSVSDQPEKKLRASFSRPSLAAILDYRRHVDEAIETLMAGEPPVEAERRLVLGLHHEQQHQELLVTDIKHAFWSNPLRPAYREALLPAAELNPEPQSWRSFAGGLAEIGYSGPEFCFDNEQPRHRVYLQPFDLATRPVCCAEYLQFIEEGAYRRPELWLADGWQTVQNQHLQAPLYWHQETGQGETAEGEWSIFTLRGDVSIHTLLSAPVCHLSYYEADAFARWAGAKLPTELEWEVAAAETLSEGAGPEPLDLLEGEALHPAAASELRSPGLDAAPYGSSGRLAQRREPLRQLFGGVWEWTASAYLGYPGYSAVPGALGEYNGKFMSGQMVLRGGSVATPASHLRETYRNFFPPATRWQFSGLRLARR